MPTKILVPRASGEGGMGVVDNAWGHAYFDSGNFKTGDFSDSIMISGLPLDQAITQGGLGGKWNDGATAGDIYYNGGNVGIGTANPGYAMLHIDATSSTTDPFYIKRGGDSYMTCENGGDVIIGSLRFNNTDTPEVKSTSVGQNGSFTFYTSEGSQQPTGRMGINYTGVGIGTVYPGYPLDVRGWISAQADALSTDAVINLAGSNSSSYASISRIKSVSESDTNSSSALTFSTRDTANAISEAVRIDSVGSVGIGTKNPTARLEVVTTDVNQYALKATIENGNRLGGIFRDSQSNGTIGAYNSADTAKVWLNTNGDSYFNGGNVGIGTALPGAKLHVNGDFNVGVGDGTINDMCQLSGIVSTGFGNNTVTGTNTKFTSELVVGDEVYINLATYTITSIASDTSMAVTPVTGTTSGAGFYRVTKKELIFADKLTTNVGIDNTTPSHNLTLGSATSTGTTSARLKVYRGVDDAGQNLEMGFNHITVTRDSNPLSSAQSTFSIKQKGSDGTRTAMHIDTESRVGIGTANPTMELDVVGGLRGSTFEAVTSSGYSAVFSETNDSPVIKFMGGSSATGLNYSLGVDAINGNNNRFLINRMDDANALKANLLTIHSNGNVGIGTTDPLSHFVVKDGTDATATSFEINCGDNFVKIDALQRGNSNQPSPITYTAEKHVFKGSIGGAGGAGNVGIGTASPSRPS